MNWAFGFFLAAISFVFAEPYAYTITEHPYRFSTYFEMQGKGGFEGRAIKKSLAVQTTYELYNASGTYEAKGVVQTLSLGSLFIWGKDIDIYDAEGKKIGFIDGQTFTTASAKYTFYDENNQSVATAYLDHKCSGFVIFSSQDQRTLGHLKRNFVVDAVDHWDITFYEPNSFDVRLLKVFSAFVIDYQENFKEDR